MFAREAKCMRVVIEGVEKVPGLVVIMSPSGSVTISVCDHDPSRADVNIVKRRPISGIKDALPKKKS